MPNTFNLTIATPAGWVADNEVESLIVPGIDGYLGILANHAPLMTAIDIGLLTYRDYAGYDHILAVTDGFFEVSNNKATIIADTAEEADHIDINRAKLALERAQHRLKIAVTDPSIDVERARAALRRAMNRIKVAEFSEIMDPKKKTPSA
ncbi:MAG: F0F1 ATP synthase subunit epsilon [bacterium]|nr:F0F1 ATP synthase subunit epsilon [bacterium]